MAVHVSIPEIRGQYMGEKKKKKRHKKERTYEVVA